MTTVNVRGKVQFMEKSVDAVLQFRVDRQNGTFEGNAFEMNDIPQSPLIMSAFISKMFDEYEQ